MVKTGSVKLNGKVIIAAGASRGAGRGIALAAGDAGATVYVAGRTSRSGPPPVNGVPGSAEDTAEEVTRRGGQGIAHPADLSKEEEVSRLFDRVLREQGRIDGVANGVWSVNAMKVWSKKFWELDTPLWRDTIGIIHACWFLSVYATKAMSKTGGGVVAHVTDNDPSESGDPSGYRGQILHDIGHEGINRLIVGLAPDAKKENVTIVGLNPGFMRTEAVLQAMTNDKVKRQFRFDLSESPEYIGRAFVALAADRKVKRHAGRFLWVADLAREYQFTDIDGRQIPRFNPSAPMQAFPE